MPLWRLTCHISHNSTLTTLLCYPRWPSKSVLVIYFVLIWDFPDPFQVFRDSTEAKTENSDKVYMVGDKQKSGICPFIYKWGSNNFCNTSRKQRLYSQNISGQVPSARFLAGKMQIGIYKSHPDGFLLGLRDSFNFFFSLLLTLFWGRERRINKRKLKGEERE